MDSGPDVDLVNQWIEDVFRGSNATNSSIQLQNFSERHDSWHPIVSLIQSPLEHTRFFAANLLLNKVLLKCGGLDTVKFEFR